MTTSTTATAAGRATPRRGAIGATSSVTSPWVQSGALALVSAAAALAFSRVFADAGFAGPLLLAVLVPHGVGLLGRTRGWSIGATTVVGALAVLVALVWVAAGDATTYGLPTGETARRLGHLLDSGWAVFRTGIAPVDPRPGVVLLCSLAVATVALTADAVARRPDVTLAALAPSLVLFVVTGTLGTTELRVPVTIAYVTAALLELAIANAARVERRRTWFTGRRLASDASVVRSAAAVGGAALLVGVLLTPLVPGIDDGPLLRYRHSTGHSAGLGDYQGVSPLVDLRARLRERTSVELFRVKSPRALYWRLIALDRFDGTTWSLATEAKDARDVLGVSPGTRTVRQRYSITSLSDQWAPAAYRPVETNLGGARIVPESQTLIAPTQVSGLDYQVHSQIEQPPSAAAVAATVAPVPTAIAPDLALPDSFPRARIRQARAITAGAATPWDKAQALQRFFTDGSFTYDLTVKLDDDQRAIDEFLATRRGFCQQFAAAYAALARGVGIPSRVVVGFTPGDYDATGGEYVVRGGNAHAWVEVWMAGLGWRTIDPTPAGPLPGQADARAGTTAPGGRDGTTPSTTVTSTPTATSTPDAASGGAAPRRPGESTITIRSPHGSGWSTRTILLVALGAALGIVAVVLLVRRRARPGRIRRRRRLAPEPRTRVLGAWSDAVETCTAAGLPLTDALTPAEHATVVGRDPVSRAAAEPFRALVDVYEQAAYSPHPVAADAPDRAWAAADGVRAAMRDAARSSHRETVDATR